MRPSLSLGTLPPWASFQMVALLPTHPGSGVVVLFVSHCGFQTTHCFSSLKSYNFESVIRPPPHTLPSLLTVIQHLGFSSFHQDVLLLTECFSSFHGHMRV